MRFSLQQILLVLGVIATTSQCSATEVETRQLRARSDMEEATVVRNKAAAIKTAQALLIQRELAGFSDFADLFAGLETGFSVIGRESFFNYFLDKFFGTDGCTRSCNSDIQYPLFGGGYMVPYDACKSILFCNADGAILGSPFSCVPGSKWDTTNPNDVECALMADIVTECPVPECFWYERNDLKVSPLARFFGFS